MRLVPPDSQETYGRGADAERASSAAGELVHLAENQGQLDPPLAPSPRPRTGRGGPSSVRFLSRDAAMELRTHSNRSHGRSPHRWSSSRPPCASSRHALL